MWTGANSTLTVTIGGARTTADVTGTPDATAKESNVTAELRPDFTIVVDGTVRTFQDVNGNTVYPMLYNGSTYLPVRAVGELMGKTVSWNGSTQTVTLSTAAWSPMPTALATVPTASRTATKAAPMAPMQT